MTLPDRTTCLGWKAAGARDGRGSAASGVRRRVGRPHAASVHRCADGFVRAAALTAVLVALACATGVQAASLSLSNVKINARTTADEWDYVALTDGKDRTKKSEHYWFIHWPCCYNHDKTWPSATRPKMSQMKATDSNAGGLFHDGASDQYVGGPYGARYWGGLREWGKFFHEGGGGLGTGVGNPALWRDSRQTQQARKNAYDQMKKWWRGEITYSGNDDVTKDGPSGLKDYYNLNRKHRITKQLPGHLEDAVGRGVALEQPVHRLHGSGQDEGVRDQEQEFGLKLMAWI